MTGRTISELQELFVLSQTESLMLDDGNLEEVRQIAACKAEIVDSLSTGEVESPDLALQREALEFISRITDIDAKNRIRLERWRSESLLGLQQIRDHRHLMKTYSQRTEQSQTWLSRTLSVL